MSAESLTTLTKKPETFSTGVSLSDYTAPWSLSPFPPELFKSNEAEETWGAGLPFSLTQRFVWHDSVPGADRYLVVVLQPGASSRPQWPALNTQRLICLETLSNLPDEALSEASETLLQIQAFYSERVQASIAPPQLASGAKTRPKKMTPKVQIGKAYQREEFLLTEDR